MISFDFKLPTQEFPEGALTISVSGDKNFFLNDELPIHVLIKNNNNEIINSYKLSDGWWCTHYHLCYTNIEIINNKGDLLSKWDWQTFLHGDFIHQYFYNWSKRNLKSNGIAIGTHDGTTGEWVGPVNDGLLNALLVEASEKQFKKLKNKYNNYPWVKVKNVLVSTDGNQKNFYEGGYGHTNSLFLDITNQYVNENEIIPTLKDTISLNQLLIENSPIKWLHLDVEGYDAELIYSINDDLLPELIIFESLHLDDELKNKIHNYLRNKNYKVYEKNFNCLCIKNP